MQLKTSLLGSFFGFSVIGGQLSRQVFVNLGDFRSSRKLQVLHLRFIGTGLSMQNKKDLDWYCFPRGAGDHSKGTYRGSRLVGLQFLDVQVADNVYMNEV
jgi:hypothetical protein